MFYKTFVIALLLSAVQFALQAQSSKTRIILNGTVKGDIHGADKVIVYIGHDYEDSTVIRNGHYTLALPFKEAAYIYVIPKYTAENGRYRSLGILIDHPGMYTIQSDVNAPLENAVITGAPANDLYKQYQAQLKSSDEKLKNELGIKDPEKADTPVMAKYDSLRTLSKPVIIEDFVRGHPDSYASAYILVSDGRYELTGEQQEKTYGLLSSAMKSSDMGKRFYTNMQGVKNSAVGRQVADFILPEPSGKTLTFNSLQGKYRIIDFWASWCGPCRASFPHLRQVYAQYKGPQFEVLSISVDKDKNNWLKAVKEENNPWPQVMDTANVAVADFGISAVPTTILVGPDGKILIREEGFNSGGDGAIETRLKELFNKQATPRH